uniref:Uncharacterized protein n=1 Tax=Opuntia streptacantha TaxID=393608 RepID=A0A7C9AQ19_OPUST
MERYRGDRDRDRDRDRSRERDRDRDRYGGGTDFPHQPRRPSLFSDGPPVDQRRSPGNYRGGLSGPAAGGGGRRAFESPPRHSPGGTGYPPLGGGPLGEFRPMDGGVGGGFGNDFQAPPPPLSGQKRGFPFSGRGGSPDSAVV